MYLGRVRSVRVGQNVSVQNRWDICCGFFTLFLVMFIEMWMWRKEVWEWCVDETFITVINNYVRYTKAFKNTKVLKYIHVYIIIIPHKLGERSSASERREQASKQAMFQALLLWARDLLSASLLLCFSVSLFLCFSNQRPNQRFRLASSQNAGDSQTLSQLSLWIQCKKSFRKYIYLISKQYISRNGNGSVWCDIDECLNDGLLKRGASFLQNNHSIKKPKGLVSHVDDLRLTICLINLNFFSFFCGYCTLIGSRYSSQGEMWSWHNTRVTFRGKHSLLTLIIII